MTLQNDIDRKIDAVASMSKQSIVDLARGEQSRNAEFIGVKGRLDNIEHELNNGNEYHTTHQVETKHRHRVGPFWGNPTYSYHDERRINQAKYDRDITNVVENAKGVVLDEIDSILKSIEEVKRCEYDTSYYTAASGSYSLSQLDIQLRDLNSKIQVTNSTINSYNTQKATYQRSQDSNQTKVNSVDTTEIVVQGTNASQKAHILLKIWNANDADSKQIKAKILSDSDFNIYYQHNVYRSLLKLAVENGDVELFTILLEKGFDFNKQQDNKIAFKYVLDTGSDEIINKMLDTTSIEYLQQSLQALVLSNDAVNVEKLLSHKLDLISIEVSEYSLLHIALAGKSFAVAEQLIKFDPSLLTKESHSMTPAMMALRTAGDEAQEMVSFLQQCGVGFKEEVNILIEQESIDLFKYTMELIPALYQGESGIALAQKALSVNQLSIVRILQEKGVDIESVLQASFTDNHDLLGNIINYYVDISTPDWVQNAMQSSYDISHNESDIAISGDVLITGDIT